MTTDNYIYLCDPSKNNTCQKVDCQRSCFFVTESLYSLDKKQYFYDKFVLYRYMGEDIPPERIKSMKELVRKE